MIKVIGNENCSRCLQVKNILSNNGIDYLYVLFPLLKREEQDVIFEKATKKGLANFPIILKDDEVVSLQEVIA